MNIVAIERSSPPCGPAGQPLIARPERTPVGDLQPSQARPIDIAGRRVSGGRPTGDGAPAIWGVAGCPFDESENALFNSGVWYPSVKERAHPVVGGSTERRNHPERDGFE